MCSIVEDLLARGHQLRRGRAVLAGLRVAVPAREVGTGDLHAQAVAGEEGERGRPEVDRVLVDLPRYDRARRGEGEGAGRGIALAGAGADDPIGDVDRAPVRPDIDEAGDEIGVGRG